MKLIGVDGSQKDNGREDWEVLKSVKMSV